VLPAVTVHHAAFMACRRLIGHQPAVTHVPRGHSSGALIVYHLLGVARSTGFLGGLMRPAAPTCGRVGGRVALLG